MPRMEIAFAIGAVAAAIAVGGALYAIHPNGFTNNSLAGITGASPSSTSSLPPPQSVASSAPSVSTPNSTSTASIGGIGNSTAGGANSTGQGASQPHSPSTPSPGTATGGY